MYLIMFGLRRKRMDTGILLKEKGYMQKVHHVNCLLSLECMTL